MKKKLLLAGAMLLLAVAAVTGFAAYEKSNVSDLLDANVEALTRNETGKKECFNTITSDPAHQVRYCPTCDFVPGTDTWYAPADKC